MGIVEPMEEGVAWWKDSRGLGRALAPFTRADGVVIRAGGVLGSASKLPASLEVTRPTNARVSSPTPPAPSTTHAPAVTSSVEVFPSMPDVEPTVAAEASSPSALHITSESPSQAPSSTSSATSYSPADLPVIEVANDIAPRLDTSSGVALKMSPESARILANIGGVVLTRISPTIHKTKHYPLTSSEEEQLAKAVAMVMERRCQVVLEAGDDLLALAAVLGMALAEREAKAQLEVKARKKKAAAEDDHETRDHAA